MIIGIDIDNTVTYTTEMIMHYATIYGQERGLNTVPDLSGYYLEECLGWSSESVDDFFALYLESIYREVRPKEHAAEVIQHLHRHHQIVLITSRNHMFPGIKQVTTEWLKVHGITYDELVLNATSNMHHFSKLNVCMQHKVNLMVEDHHDLAQELSAFIPVILFDYPYNKKVQNGSIYRVHNWIQVQNWIEQLCEDCGIA